MMTASTVCIALMRLLWLTEQRPSFFYGSASVVSAEKLELRALMSLAAIAVCYRSSISFSLWSAWVLQVL
jgi:hypothetical protein